MRFIQQTWRLAALIVLAMPLAAATAENPKAVPTSWGKPVNGLQAGIRVKPRNPLPNSALELQIVIRNVGQEKVVFRYDPALYFWGSSDAGIVSARAAYAYGGYWAPGGYLEPKLAPGEEYTIAGMPIFRSTTKVDASLVGLPVPQTEPKKTTLQPGEYRIGADRVELRSGTGKQLDLSTGYLDVVVLPDRK